MARKKSGRKNVKPSLRLYEVAYVIRDRELVQVKARSRAEARRLARNGTNVLGAERIGPGRPFVRRAKEER